MLGIGHPFIGDFTTELIKGKYDISVLDIPKRDRFGN